MNSYEITRYSSRGSSRESLELLWVESQSTSSYSINEINRRYEENLNNLEPMFVFMLHHTDFEDGMSNEAIQFISHFIEENECVTLLWLHGVYGRHQDDETVVSGIMLILAYLQPNISDNFIDLIKAGLIDDSPLVIEAAVCLAESWGTDACYDALNKVSLKVPALEIYRQQVLLYKVC